MIQVVQIMSLKPCLPTLLALLGGYRNPGASTEDFNSADSSHCQFVRHSDPNAHTNSTYPRTGMIQSTIVTTTQLLPIQRNNVIIKMLSVMYIILLCVCVTDKLDLLITSLDFLSSNFYKGITLQLRESRAKRYQQRSWVQG
jgi:hypothetical protein